MIRSTTILLSLSFLLVPAFISAEEEPNTSEGLLPALCRQILSEDKWTFDKIVQEVKAIPSNVIAGVMDKIEDTTESLADRVESNKAGSDATPSSLSQGQVSKVLGATTDKGLDLLALLIRHWGWTISGLALVYIGWRLARPV